MASANLHNGFQTLPPDHGNATQYRLNGSHFQLLLPQWASGQPREAEDAEQNNLEGSVAALLSLLSEHSSSPPIHASPFKILLNCNLSLWFLTCHATTHLTNTLLWICRSVYSCTQLLLFYGVLKLYTWTHSKRSIAEIFLWIKFCAPHRNLSAFLDIH